MLGRIGCLLGRWDVSRAHGYQEVVCLRGWPDNSTFLLSNPVRVVGTDASILQNADPGQVLGSEEPMSGQPGQTAA